MITSPIDDTRPVRDGEQLDVARLQDYLTAHLPEAAGKTLDRRAVSARPFEPDVPDPPGRAGMGLAPASLRQSSQDGPRHGPRVPHPLPALPGLRSCAGARALL